MKILHIVAFLLVVVGALNWGLVGIGWLVGGSEWNIVHMLVGSWMQVEAAVDILVGLSGVWLAIKHSKECKECVAK